MDEVIAENPKAKRGRPKLTRREKTSYRPKRVRRTGKELIAFRAMLKAERKKGVPVAELARKHSITPTYIYLLR